MRYPLRLTAVAVAMSFAGAAVHAVEATQWNPQMDASSQMAATTTSGTTTATDATRTPLAWIEDRHEASEFHDIATRHSTTSRAAVLDELRQARAEGLLNDTGEAGASDRVLANRQAFVESEHQRLMALNVPAEEDQIAQMAARSAQDDGWASSATGESPSRLDEPYAFNASPPREQPFSAQSSGTGSTAAPIEDRSGESPAATMPEPSDPSLVDTAPRTDSRTQ
jgi:hypothetical protein